MLGHAALAAHVYISHSIHVDLPGWSKGSVGSPLHFSEVEKEKEIMLLPSQTENLPPSQLTAVLFLGAAVP